MTRHTKPYGCGKRRFVSRRDAKRFIKRRSALVGASAYQCDDCEGFWHVTTADAGDRRFFRERKRNA